jgi:hypothetical protein
MKGGTKISPDVISNNLLLDIHTKSKGSFLGVWRAGTCRE